MPKNVLSSTFAPRDSGQWLIAKTGSTWDSQVLNNLMHSVLCIVNVSLKPSHNWTKYTLCDGFAENIFKCFQVMEDVTKSVNESERRQLMIQAIRDMESMCDSWEQSGVRLHKSICREWHILHPIGKPEDWTADSDRLFWISAVNLRLKLQFREVWGKALFRRCFVQGIRYRQQMYVCVCAVARFLQVSDHSQSWNTFASTMRHGRPLYVHDLFLLARVRRL